VLVICFAKLEAKPDASFGAAASFFVVTSWLAEP
jgi:hypothetical protein